MSNKLNIEGEVRVIEGVFLNTHIYSGCSHNVFEAEIGTNIHPGVKYDNLLLVSFKDQGGTNWKLKFKEHNGTTYTEIEEPDEISLIFRGDSEEALMVEAMEVLAKIGRQQINKKHPKQNFILKMVQKIKRIWLVIKS